MTIRLVHYEDHDDGHYHRLMLSGVTNLFLRQVVVGLWARLDADDRADLIQELSHYQVSGDAFLSPTAHAIAIAGREEDETRGAVMFDLQALRNAGERVRPPYEPDEGQPRTSGPLSELWRNDRILGARIIKREPPRLIRTVIGKLGDTDGGIELDKPIAGLRLWNIGEFDLLEQE